MSWELGKLARVTFEFPDGRVITATVDSAEIQLNELFHDPSRLWQLGASGSNMDLQSLAQFGMTTWRAVLAGRMMQLTFMDRAEAQETLAQKKTASEWRCDFCGAIMKREQTQCTKCGGYRSFLYE